MCIQNKRERERERERESIFTTVALDLQKFCPISINWPIEREIKFSQKSILNFIRVGFICDILRDSRTDKLLLLKNFLSFLGAIKKSLWKYRHDTKLARLKSFLSTSYYKVLLKKIAITNVKNV